MSTPPPVPFKSPQEGERGNPLLAHLSQQRNARLNNYLTGSQAYDLQPSPTHAYLEEFDSVPSTPDREIRPNFGVGGNGYGGIGLGSPMAGSPNLSSPGLDATEKDPLDTGFGNNQYPSNHFLTPANYPSRGPGGGQQPRNFSEKSYTQPGKRGCLPTNPTKRRWVLIGLPIILVIIAAGAAVGVYFGVVKKPATTGSSAGGLGGNSTAPVNFGVAGTGKTGSTVVSDLGVSFTYVNTFDGMWAQNPQNPYSVSQQTAWMCL
jgi:hypothetical protein